MRKSILRTQAAAELQPVTSPFTPIRRTEKEQKTDVTIMHLPALIWEVIIQ